MEILVFDKFIDFLTELIIINWQISIDWINEKSRIEYRELSKFKFLQAVERKSIPKHSEACSVELHKPNDVSKTCPQEPQHPNNCKRIQTLIEPR